MVHIDMILVLQHHFDTILRAIYPRQRLLDLHEDYFYLYEKTNCFRINFFKKKNSMQIIKIENTLKVKLEVLLHLERVVHV